MPADPTASRSRPPLGGHAGQSLRILVVDENPRDRETIRELLGSGPAPIETIDLEEPGALERTLAAGGFDLVIADHRPSWIDAFALLESVRKLDPHFPVILCTGSGSEELAVAAMKAGFDDYVLKHPHHISRLTSAVRSGLDEALRRRIAHEAETRYRSLFEGVPVGLCRATPTGQILDANPALVRMLGYPSRESLMAVNLRSLYVDPTNLQRMRRQIDTEGEARDWEVCWKRYAGQLIWIRKHVRAVRDSEGRLMHYEEVIEDITEAKRAREELQESNQFRQEIISGAGEGIIVYDRDLRYVVWNRFMEALTGLPAEKVVGRRPLDLFPQLKEHGIDTLLERALAGETVSSDDVPLTVVGRSGWVTATYGPHRNAAGEIVGVIGIIRDVTERRRAEEALRASEERFRIMADAAPVMIWIDDAEGLCTYFNKPWLDFTGRTLEQEMGRGSRESIHVDDLPAFTATYEAAFAAQDTYQTEYRLRRADGQYRWILETAMPRFTPSGEFEGFIGSALDITERRRAEQALRESEQRFRLMADAAPVLIWISGADALCTYFNKPWLDFTGRPLDQQIGTGWMEGVHPDDHGRVKTFDEFETTTHEPYQIEYRLRRHDGEYRWILDTGVPRFTAEGIFEGYIGSAIDITDRRRAEEALKESEARYRTQVEQAPEAVVVLDVDTGRFVDVNENAVRLYGLSRDGLYNSGPAAMSPLRQPDGRLSEEAAREKIEEALQGGTPVFEWTHRRADGQEVPCEVRLVRLPAADRRLVRGSVTDISERKRAEKLQSALYRIAATASSAEDMDEFYAAIHGIVGELMYAKNFYLAIYDPSSERVSFPYFVDEADAPPLPKKLGKGLTEYVLRTGQPLLAAEENFHSMVERGDVELVGTWSVDWLGVPLTRGGEVFGVLVVQSYDPRFRYGAAEKEVLTFVSQQIAVALERKRSQDAIRESEERYRLLFERNLAGVYRTTIDGRILECNDALARTFGYASRDELIGRDIRMLYPAEGQRKEFLDALFQARNLTNFEMCGQHKRGHTIWTLENASLLADEAAGEIIIEGTLTEITERRLLEEQLQQSQKMEAIGQLAGGVAHDFNNLLTSVLGYSEMALRQLPPDHPIRSEIQEIQKAGERAAHLTRQLLAFSRKQVFETKGLDLNALIEESSRMLSRLLGERISLVTQLDSALGSIRADPGQVEQVLINLVLNARDAMPEGGTLTIRTENSDREASSRDHAGPAPGHYVAVCVADTGIGMDPETQKRIFEPFFSTKEKPHGTGLGLATVYGIVSQSGGHVAVQSAPGLGATFTVYFPRVAVSVPEQDAPAAITSAAGATSGSETILLVEDEDAVRDLTRRCLVGGGYTVIPAGSAEEAIDLAAEHDGHIDLLLTDVVMPGASGPQLARRLLERRPDVRVLYVSGYTDAAMASEGILDSGVSFLQKPFTPEALSRKVRDILDELNAPLASADDYSPLPSGAPNVRSKEPR